jgi:hypothetical protein
MKRPSKGNTRYFSSIDSNAKSYILGFIAADGCITRSSTRQGSSPTLSITIHRKDVAVLEFIKSEIGFHHKIQSIRRKSGFNKDVNTDHVRIAITDKQLTGDLLNLGVSYRKSLSMGNILDNIPKLYRKSFIIGYFDGDGSVSLPKPKNKYLKSLGKMSDYPSYRTTVCIRGTQELLLGIKEELSLDTATIFKYDSTPRLDLTNKRDIVKLFKCYDECPFFLKRKHDVFLERIGHPSYRL